DFTRHNIEPRRQFLSQRLSIRIPANYKGIKRDKPVVFRLVPRGDPAGIRTQDPYIKSVLLYQLSYGILILKRITLLCLKCCKGRKNPYSCQIFRHIFLPYINKSLFFSLKKTKKVVLQLSYGRHQTCLYIK